MSRVTLQVIRSLQQTPLFRVQRNLCLTSTSNLNFTKNNSNFVTFNSTGLADNSKMTKAELQARRIENDVRPSIFRLVDQ